MTKEISKEVIAKVFGLYLGAECRLITGQLFRVTGQTIDSVRELELTAHQLILSDLSDISDEEKEEISKICDMGEFPGYVEDLLGYLMDGPPTGDWYISTRDALNTIDFLRSRGYMPPAFGITDLFEAGIAVRKNKEV